MAWAAADDDDDAGDLFGDDDDGAAAKKIAENAAAAAAAKPKEEKKVKKEEIAKSAVIYEVKPIEAGQDMKAIEASIRSIKMDGLVWGEEFNIEDVAFGIQKLVVQAIIEDEKVGLDQLEEAMAAFPEQIQSSDFCSMSKVSGR